MTDREQALEKIVTRFRLDLARFWNEQKILFMSNFDRLGYVFDDNAEAMKLVESLREAAPKPIPKWDDIWDYTTLHTANVISEKITDAARLSMIASGLKAGPTYGTNISFTLGNPKAVSYLKDVGAKLVTNIDDTTRKGIQRIVTGAMESGQSYGKTAKDIREMFNGFSELKPQQHIKDRATLVAVTESGNAYEQAALFQAQAAQEAGLPQEKFWATVGDDRVSDGCAENEDAGWIPLDDTFPSGDDAPLRFPGCRCTMLTRLAEDTKERQPFEPEQMKAGETLQMSNDEFSDKLNNILQNKYPSMDTYGYSDTVNFGTNDSTDSKLLKDKATKNLSATTGMSEKEASDFIHNWAITSNDNNYDALRIQMEASKQFGAELSKWQESKISELMSQGAIPGRLKKDVIEKGVSTIYKETQDAINKAGINLDSTVDLYRGVKVTVTSTYEIGEKVEFAGNALESWTTDYTTAQDFGNLVMKRTVKLSDIFSTPGLGFGCNSESEIVIINRKMKNVVEIVKKGK